MPIYEFRCRKCGATFEALRRVGDDGRTLACPECGAQRPEKLFSSFGAPSGCGTPPAGGSSFG
jgi:putative FmdB family regulatory protein